MLITVIVVSSYFSDRPASEVFCRFEKVLWLCLAEWGGEQWRSAFLRCGEGDAEKNVFYEYEFLMELLEMCFSVVYLHYLIVVVV